jgi:membrane-associated phospholipid phosphatase
MGTPTERNRAARVPAGQGDGSAEPPLVNSTPRVGPRNARRMRTGLWLLFGLLGAAALLYAALFSYRFAEVQLGPFAPLAAGLVVGAALAIGGPWLLVRERRPLEAALMRGIRWLGTRLEATGWPERLARRFPRLARFLGSRFARTPTGLALTLGLVAAGALLWNVLELLFEVVSGSPTVGVDQRIINLMATLRTPALDQVMYVATFLGNGQTITVFATAAVLVALLARRWKDAALLVLALLASEVFVTLLKLLVHRARPLLEDARIVQGGFSFPSGHSTLSATFYGTLAYLLIRGTRREGLRALIGVAAALLVLTIGTSRVYLGVHYPSDVLAGWAAGALWVVLVFVAEHVWSPDRAPRKLSARARAATATVAVALAVVASVYVSTLYRTLPPPPTPPPPIRDVVALDAVASTVEGQLPHYTEGLTGHPQEPVSLVFVGTMAQIEGAFHAAGWTEAKRYGFGALAGGITAAVAHRPDPAGPVTPSFLANEPNALAFSLPVGTTFAERHHIRLWTTTVATSAGQPVWLATASFDRGFELAPSTGLPTHQIAPDIDAERTFVATSLQSTGLVTSNQAIQLVPPESGRNFDGDPFHTDGIALILQIGERPS